MHTLGWDASATEPARFLAILVKGAALAPVVPAE